MEIYKARAKYLKVSPTKVRPIVDLIRGHRASRAVEWLITRPNRKTEIVLKVVKSAIANAINVSGDQNNDYTISVAKVDIGPTQKYAIPGAMGKSVVRRRRFSHIEIGVKPMGKKTNSKEVVRGTKG